MSLISIIIPVYKVEQYMSRCLDSILSQTFSDFEVILVDDGSPDRCPEICDEYARKDSRVHVIHQTNSGPSAARNAGLDHAFNSISSYLAFIDSDDCVHPRYLEFLYQAVLTMQADIAVCHHEYIQDDKLPEYKEYADFRPALIDAEDLMINESSSFNYVWGKLFSKKCLDHLRFPTDVSFGEDNLIIYQTFFNAEKIAILSEQLYFYYYNPSGITKSRWNPTNLQCFYGIEAQLNYYAENGYTRAYKKEIELLIQQCAYQIFRIRQDKSNYLKNRKYEKKLKNQMKSILGNNPEYKVTDRPMWFEALHPLVSYINRIKAALSRRISKLRQK